MHLKVDLYLDALRGELPITALKRQVHLHLLEVCERCHREFVAAGVGLSPHASEPVPAGPRDLDPLHLRRADVEAAKERLSLLRAVAAEAREDLGRLLRLPPECWHDRVAGTRTRMQSRAFAELVLSESRARIRTGPRQAAVLAALVPVALRWASPETSAWLPALLAHADAQRANALRVVGDLPAADRIFDELNAALARSPLGEPAARAEIASLEASLCIDNRRFERAARCLAAAVEDYRRAGQPDGVARALIQSANLQQSLGRPEEVLPLLDRAARALGGSSEPYLLAATVTGRINALCDLERSPDARHLLQQSRQLYLETDDPHLEATFTMLSGRVALGLGHLAEAEIYFADARDRFLALDRDYDAILTAIYLADALLAAGKSSELRRLAAELVPLFQTRDVARETLAALRLFAEAAQSEAVTAAVLSEVRERLQGGPLGASSERVRMNDPGCGLAPGVG
jgi:tetratricopeptide (TPR) repeat protein